MQISKWGLVLIFIIGFLGGSLASLMNKPVFAQGGGASLPRIFVNDDEMIPAANGEIHIYTVAEPYEACNIVGGAGKGNLWFMTECNIPSNNSTKK